MKQTFLKLTVFLSLTTFIFSSCSVDELEQRGEVKSATKVTNIKADFEIDAKPASLMARFNSTSENAAIFKWSFPGGTPSSSSAENSPIIEYPESGEYTVTLEVVNGTATDTYSTTIQL